MKTPPRHFNPPPMFGLRVDLFSLDGVPLRQKRKLATAALNAIGRASVIAQMTEQALRQQKAYFDRHP